jgi:molybdopterin-guanine dinucleotide biosynthesis protein A
MKILGAIIAGGQSSRMGTEKAFVALDGVSLIVRVMSRIRFQVDATIINANGDPVRFAYLHVLVVPDQLPTTTPLAGLHACLRHAASHGFDAVLTVGSDQPFLPLDLVHRLEEEGRATGAAVGQSGGQTHYLTGLWSAALAPELERQIKKGMRRVQDFVSHVATEKVEWLTFPHDPFFNVNTPEDLLQAEAIVKAMDRSGKALSETA